MRKLICFVCSIVLALSALPAKAVDAPGKPVIVEIGAQSQVSVAAIAQGPNKVYMPLIVTPKCYALNPLQPGAAATVCASLSDYAGANALAGYVATINNGAPLVFQTDLPAHAVTIPQQSITIGPVNQAPVSALRVRISQMAYMTETDGAASAAGADASNPMLARGAWVIKNALQNENEGNPTLFPVSILTMHYSQPIEGSNRSTPFAECGQSIGLYVYGYPWDIQFSDATAAGGNIWLRMKYPSCAAMDAFPWIRLQNFWSTLKTFAKWQDIDQQAGIGPTTYHAAIQVSDPQGTISTVNVIIVVTVIGGIVLIAVFPPSGAGWWLLVGTAAL